MKLEKNYNSLLFEAIEFANWAYRKKKRKLTDAPYVAHPFHVMMLLLFYGVTPHKIDGLIILIAGLLHDALEDNPEEVTFDLIREKFGEEVAKIVLGVTLDPANNDKRLSRKKILGSDWKIRIIKVADILSNTMSTISGIEKLGLEKVQKSFSQPIADRISMEREFLESALHLNESGRIEYQALSQLRIKALKAIDELKAMTKKVE